METPAQSRTLALIGARGGSQGLKDKNVLDFHGRPLIAWSIAAALGAKSVSDVVVSTDSPRIREAALAAGARVPFLRPDELAENQSNINDAIVHALEWLAEHERQSYDFVVLLQPTQPLRGTEFIERAVTQYLACADQKRDTMVSVVPADAKAAYLMRAGDAEDRRGDFVEFALQKEQISPNRQAMPAYYYPAGAFYMAPTDLFLKQRTFYGEATRYIVASAREAIDIDSREDFDAAWKMFAEEPIDA